MIGRRATLVFVVLFVMPLVGCSLFSQEASNQHFLCGANQGCTYSVNVGDTLVVRLEANPSTGYTWEWTRAESPSRSIFEMVGQPQFEPASDAMGAPGTMTFRFRVVRAGSETLSLIYHRPWEEGVEPERTYEVHIVASD